MRTGKIIKGIVGREEGCGGRGVLGRAMEEGESGVIGGRRRGASEVCDHCEKGLMGSV